MAEPLLNRERAYVAEVVIIDREVSPKGIAARASNFKQGGFNAKILFWVTPLYQIADSVYSLLFFSEGQMIGGALRNA